jgi:Ca2+-binding EF-hand superfamily protein
MRLAASVAVVLALALLVGCGPAKEKVMDKVEKGVEAGVGAAFNAADTNDDGKITMDEFTSAEKADDKDTRETFQRLDKNGNGSISRGEFKEAFQELRRGFKKMKKERERKGRDK